MTGFGFGFGLGLGLETDRVVSEEGARIGPVGRVGYVILLDLQGQFSRTLAETDTLCPDEWQRTHSRDTHRLAGAAMEIVVQRVHVPEKVT